MTVPNCNKSFQIGKIQLLIWKMTTSDWSMIFSFCQMQCPVGGKTHIPVGNADVPFWRRYVSNWTHAISNWKCDFRIGSETFYLEYKFLLWKCKFPIRKSSYSLENDNLQLEQYRSEGVPERRIFVPGRVGKRIGSAFPFPSRPGPTRPDPTRPAISTGSFPDRKVSIWGPSVLGPSGPFQGRNSCLGAGLYQKIIDFVRKYMIVWEILRFS